MIDSSGPRLDCAGRSLDLSRPQIMGVLNVTPDSFSDGGTLFDAGRIDTDALCRRAETMVASGAAILDIGGESTRPGAAAVSEQEELDRVIGALDILSSRIEAVFSLDTSTPQVMTTGAASGAGLLNDVRALSRPGALAAAAATGLPVCLMHMQGTPATMQQNPQYGDLVATVREFLLDRAAAAIDAGIDRGKLLIDPGFGFGKTLAHNFSLLKHLPDFAELGYPLLVGLSRKSMIAGVIDRNTDQRLSASLALATLAAAGGARIIRTHDVPETFDALAMVSAMETMGA